MSTDLTLLLCRSSPKKGQERGRREEREAGRKPGERDKEAGREGQGTHVALAAGTHFTIKFSTLPKLLLTQEAVCAGVTSDT